MYLVYTVNHQAYAFDDINHARDFRNEMNSRNQMTWYIMDLFVNQPCDRECEQRGIQIDKPKFPV